MHEIIENFQNFGKFPQSQANLHKILEDFVKILGEKIENDQKLYFSEGSEEHPTMANFSILLNFPLYFLLFYLNAKITF